MSKDYKEIIKKMVLPPHVKEIIEGGAEIIIPDTKEHLFDLALGGKDNMTLILMLTAKLLEKPTLLSVRTVFQ